MRIIDIMNVIDHNYDVVQDAKYSIHPKSPDFVCRYMTIGKILSFAVDQKLNKSETLQLFCEGYRDVIANPINGYSEFFAEDANIGVQLFSEYGFDNLKFYSNPLKRKKMYNQVDVNKLLSWVKTGEIRPPLLYPLIVGCGAMGMEIGKVLTSKGFNFSCVEPGYGFNSLDEYAENYHEKKRMELKSLKYVAFDFTSPIQVIKNIRWYSEHKMNAVVGTTMLNLKDTERLVAASGTGLVYSLSFGGHSSLSDSANEAFKAAEFIKDRHGFYNYEEIVKEKFNEVVTNHVLMGKAK